MTLNLNGKKECIIEKCDHREYMDSNHESPSPPTEAKVDRLSCHTKYNGIAVTRMASAR